MKFIEKARRRKISHGLLYNQFNEEIIVLQRVYSAFKDLVDEIQVDVLLIEPEDGYSMLGGSRNYLSNELGLSERSRLHRLTKDDYMPAEIVKDMQNIPRLAYMSCIHPEVTIIGVPSRKNESLVKGLVLVPYEGSYSYKRFAKARFNRPYRDFFYNVTYESLHYAYHCLGARSFAITQLIACKYGREPRYADITLCQVEAILHFCNQHKGIRTIAFWDFDDRSCPLNEINYILETEKKLYHREISRIREKRFGFDFITLEWPLPIGHIP